MLNIPFFPYSKLFSEDEESYVAIFRDICSRGAFILQTEVAEFEAAICDITGSKYALGVGNATDAMSLGFMAAGLKEGGEVIISSHTMIATASAIKLAGCIPIPVECGKDHLIDIGAIEAAINSNTVAIMPTQLNGRVANMDAVCALAAEYGLDVYEDAAQALGAKYNGKCAGTFGKAACISFYPAKTLGCFGDGGILLCQDEDLYNRAKIIRDHGRGPDGQIRVWGLNTRLDNLQAGIMLHKLKSYAGWIDRRRELATLYSEILGGIDELVLPPLPNESTHFDIFQNFEIEAERRDELKDYLHEAGVGTLVQWSGIAVHHCKDLGFSQDLPYTDELFTKMLMLPMHHILFDDEVQKIGELIVKFYEK
jgi:dTDP-4-amino-4,6-dideoxygalactose transaminase